MKFACLLFSLLVALSACGQVPHDDYDLVIRNARIFNSRTATLSGPQTILIKDGLIAAIVPTSRRFRARRTIDAHGKLVTPGFVDTHIHPTDVFGDYAAAPEYLPADSLNACRSKLSRAYLPYGVTTALIMGQPEKWLPPVLPWMAHPSPQHLDLYTTGGALISAEKRSSYLNHVTVDSPESARQKVLAYHRLGTRHVKLYWRLRGPEFRAALAAADSLGMRAYAHLDQNVVGLDTALAWGMRHFEHLLTLDHGVLAFPRDNDAFTAHMRRHYGTGKVGFAAVRLEMVRFISENRPAEMNRLLQRLAARQASFSTTIHLMAEPFGLTYFANTRDTTLTPMQRARGQQNFRQLMRNAKQFSDLGGTLRLGTDCAQGGRAAQSEQLLLFENGFSVAQILQISTLNGAEALGLEWECGSVETGKKANLLIFDRSPFEDYKHFLSTRTVVKDGVVWHE